MGTILILRGASFTPPQDDDNTGGDNTGGDTGGGTGGGTTDTLLDSLSTYFAAGQAFGSGNTWVTNSLRAALKDVPVESYFSTRTITVTPASGAAFSLRYGTGNGLDGGAISPENTWVTDQQTYSIPTEAVYLGFNFKFTNNGSTSGSILTDFLQSILNS